MFKRLAIAFVVVGLVTIFIAEAANARAIRLRRSVGVTLYSNSPGTFVTSIFGFPGDDSYQCGEVLGELYCAKDGTEEARLACDIATGDSAARVLVLDKEAIRDGVPPNYFTKDEINFYIKDRGQREQLKGFETRAGSADPAVFVISLPTGKKNNAGFHALTDESLADWKDCDEGICSDNEALRRFIGEWDSAAGKFIPDDGFGINGEKFIHKVPGVEPLFGPDLDGLVGGTICAVVKHSQVKGNALKGPYLGLAAFKVLSRSGSLLEVEVLDADDVCGLPLYIKTPLVGAGGAGGEGQCLVSDAATDVDTAFVFAPAFPDGELRAGEGKFPAVPGTLEWDGTQWKQTVEITLDATVGQALCEEAYPGNPDVTFVDFIPVNRGSGDFEGYAFIGLTESENEDVADLKKCKEGVEGGSRYNCEEDYMDEIPTCSFNCGNNFPVDIGDDWAYFLKNVVFVDSYDSDDFESLESPYTFEGEWDFKTIGLEAGHALVTERASGETEITLYDSEDCASWGLKRRVDFSAGENLVFVDTNRDPDFEVSLNTYAFTDFLPGDDGDDKNNIFIVQYVGDKKVIYDYLPDPFTVEPGQYFIFFNDFHPSADYDDFILIGNPVSAP
jgi:hypothetical protein